MVGRFAAAAHVFLLNMMVFRTILLYLSIYGIKSIDVAVDWFIHLCLQPATFILIHTCKDFV
jgi:hypothetical protein